MEAVPLPRPEEGCMKRAYVTTCSECGGDRPNYSGICDGCAPEYADPPFVDDVQPDQREPKDQTA